MPLPLPSFFTELQMATSYEWTINQGQDETLDITFKDSSGSPITLHGLSPAVTAEMQLREAFTSSSSSAKVLSAATAATATVTFTGANNVADKTLTITDTAGTGKTFKVSSSSTGTQLTAASTGVLQVLSVEDKANASDAANALAAGINGASINITASASGEVVTLTQDAAGTAGNTTITTSFPNATAIDFTGGLDADITISSSTTGLVTVLLPNATTAALSAPETYLYDIELTNYPSDGRKFRLLEGTIKVRPEVTR